MARQSFLWTALPNGVNVDERGVKVSVMISPRLEPLDDPAVLASFPDWIDWPATLAGASFAISYGGAVVTVPASQTTGANRVDTALGTADSLVWRALFKPDLYVRGFQYQDRSAAKIVSYDTVQLTELVQGLYATLAAAGDRMPLVSDVLNDPNWAAVVAAVTVMDQEATDPDTGRHDPRRQFARFRDEPFANAGGGAEPLWQTLGRVQLFHTPGSASHTATRRRNDDPRIAATTLEYAQTPLPAKADFAHQLDFHQVVSAMNAYPTLLRRLGIVIDFVLDRSAFTKSADAPLTVAVTFAQPGPATRDTRSAAPVLHVALSDRDFAPVSNPLLDPDGLRVRDRLLELDPKRFALLQMDVDGAGLKLMNFARSLARMEPGDERVDPVTRHENEVGAPALRTAGLMLVQTRRSRMLQTKLADNTAMNDLTKLVFAANPNASPPLLWAEDVVRGFRYDVWDANTGVWRSLCEREAGYDVAGVRVTPAAGKEEGTVRLAATTSPDPTADPDVMWLHEALVSWTGWSLAAPQPGRAIKPDDSVPKTGTRTEAVLPPGLHFQSHFQAVPKSLPRLRFGRRYWIRARAVDLAGNSLPPQPDDFGHENPQRLAQPYLRYEPLAAPAIALVQHDDGTTERPNEGESMQRLVIRSFNDVPSDNAIPTTPQTARRFAVPPQSSVKDAEQHGMLDAAGVVDATTFTMLAHDKDLDARDPAASLIQEPVLVRGPQDAKSVDTAFAAYREGRRLTYLPDPLAEEVAVRVFGHPHIPDTKVLTIPLYPDGRWPEARPFIIEAVEHPGRAPAYDAATRVLHVPVEKGDRITVRLSMKLSKHTLRELMGVWRWVAKPTSTLEIAALDGQHWMLTPWRTLELVHAVQRPLIAPDVEKLQISRGYHATSAVPRFEARCSIKSTDRIDVHGSWHEPQDDAALGNADVPRNDIAFSLKITTPQSYAQRELGHDRGGAADHVIVGEDRIAVNLPSDFRAPKYHEFHDTRYRRIEYHLEATSAFREYLPAALVIDPVSNTPTEANITVTGPATAGWVKSSAPPPAPHVLYVVPTFGWSRSNVPGGAATTMRRGGGLRVYLDRPWNVSGYGEMLGVVLPPASFGGDPDTTPAGAPYRTFVTQWGADPIWKSRFVAGLAPSRQHFPLQRTGPDATGAWLPAGAPASEADQPPGAFDVANVTSYARAAVDVAPHDVFYDPERQLWYCDIEIDQGASYWPFVRLALARYQPVSEWGVSLSTIVLADFMPLTADRWLIVQRTAQSRTRSLTVYGYSYEDSSGHLEAPAYVAPTTVFDVWVEQLDPTLGEDFGWHRLPDAVAMPAGAAPRPVAPHHSARFMTASEILRAVDLRRSGNFDQLVSENLVGAIGSFFALWDGTVTLPAGLPPDGRFRLVIAEYEEYIVDDDRRHVRVHTKKGRRLVFLEHVELI